MLQAAINNIIVEVTTKYIGNISQILRMSSIQQGASVDHADYVNIMGKVISVPKTFCEKKEYKGFSTKDIQPGDTAIFSFAVIYDFIQKEPDAEPVYKNRIWHEGKEYFICDIRHVFAVIRNEQIIMVNGYVMLSPFEEGKIILAAESKKTKGTTQSQIMYINNPKENQQPLEATQGDLAYFNPMIAQKYQINNKPFIILQQSQILGVTQPV